MRKVWSVTRHTLIIVAVLSIGGWLTNAMLSPGSAKFLGWQYMLWQLATLVYLIFAPRPAPEIYRVGESHGVGRR
jgi:hypothetical protein